MVTNTVTKIPNGHKHGIYQSKTSSLRDFTQPQRKIAPFRKSPANYRPPRIVLEKQSMEWVMGNTTVMSPIALNQIRISGGPT